MISKYILPVVFILALSSCKEKPCFIVDGKVSYKAFEGSRIYLVALDAPITRNVDSTVVINGTFSFRVKADSTIAKILRLPIRYPNMAEDLVVITEPGTLHAVIGTKSYGEGTRLNDKLQQWKQAKNTYDSLQTSIFEGKNLQNMEKKDVDSLIAAANKVKDSFLPGIVNLINENLNNGIGLLLFKVYYQQLSPETREAVEKATKGVYYRKDKQLKNMIQRN
jgi:hypothetical protein